MGGGTSYFNKLTSPAAVESAMDESRQLGREKFLKQFGFLPSRKYELIHQNSTYDSKAIAAVAFGYQHGIRPLTPEECNGGISYGHAGWALSRLGFDVNGIDTNDWRLDEVRRVIDAYLDMMVSEKAGKAVDKKTLLNNLAAENSKRTYRAYELKMQNISFALQALGRPWSETFKPAGNYQRLLRYEIEDRLGLHQEDISVVKLKPLSPAQEARLSKIDWATRDASNRELGKNGERYVLERERFRLIDSGHPKLAAQVRWLANERDGDGYDIHSYRVDGTPIQIEVKTTSREHETAFFISDNEMRKSKEYSTTFELHRVSRFPSNPAVVVFRAPLDKHWSFVACAFRATPQKD